MFAPGNPMALSYNLLRLKREFLEAARGHGEENSPIKSKKYATERLYNY